MINLDVALGAIHPNYAPGGGGNGWYRIPMVRCRHCRQDTTQIAINESHRYDGVHTLCNVLPPMGTDKRRYYSVELAKWLRAQIQPGQQQALF